VDYKKIENPVDYNIKFTPCDPSVLSVNEQCEITVHKRDSAFVTLYCENNDNVYKDTMSVLVGLPSNKDSYYISMGYDLNNDGFMSDYEMSEIEEVDQWYQKDASLMKNIKVVNSSIQWEYGVTTLLDFTKNTKLRELKIGDPWKIYYDMSLQIKTPNFPDLENLYVVASDLCTPKMKDLHLCECPKLDTIRVFYFELKNLTIERAEHLRFIHLCCDGMNEIDLSRCSNLNNITMYDMECPSRCTVILSPKVYEKYLNKDPECHFDIDDDITVKKAE